MKPYFAKTPKLFKFLFRNWVWSFSKKEKIIYLTFDDGPTPEITQWILNQLNKYNAKATFFCIGKNIVKYPEIYTKIVKAEHAIGNHTYNHLNGWKTTTEKYLEDINLAQEAISKYSKFKIQNPVLSVVEASKLFRPPYGKLTLSQSKKIRKKGYKIIMWNVLSADFDPSITKKECLENVIKNVSNGSIIVFHDSVKASEKLKYVLPKIIEYYSEKGFVFKSIDL